MITKAPIIQQHEITMLCNNRCGFCYNPERCLKGVNPKKEDLQRNIRVAETSIEKGVMAVCLTGGEPLLLGNHLYEILNIYRQAGCYISINTNGRLATPRAVDRLSALGLNSALISLHGAGDLHNRMVGEKNAFQETWRGIENFRARGIRVVPNFVATAKNIHGLFAVGQELAAAGFKFMTATPFLPSWGAASHPQFILSEEQFRNYYRTIKAISKLGIEVDSTLPIPPCVLIKLFPENWQEFLNVQSARVCMAGRSFGVISPEGYIRSCIQAPYLPEFGGNVLENYDRSWAKANNWAEENLLPPECRDCKALALCGGGCRTSCLWRNNGSLEGKTMYMGEPLTEEQTKPFKAKVTINTSLSDSEGLYKWNYWIKFRDDGYGTIAFNPYNQSFAILSIKNKDLLKQNSKAVKFNSAKTIKIMKAIGAISPYINNENEDDSIPEIITTTFPRTLLPRLSQSFVGDDAVYCLRADTGERYFF